MLAAGSGNLLFVLAPPGGVNAAAPSLWISGRGRGVCSTDWLRAMPTHDGGRSAGTGTARGHDAIGRHHNAE